MGVIYEYFEAPSDADAAAVVDRIGGPSDITGDRVTQARRSLFSRRQEPVEMVEPGALVAYPSLEGRGIDPVVQLGTLEELLTGRSFEDALEGLGDGVVAERAGGQRLVQRVSPSLIDAFANATPQRLSTVVDPWSRTEEFGGLADPHDLAVFVAALADLARAARSTGAGVYCWVSA